MTDYNFRSDAGQEAFIRDLLDGKISISGGALPPPSEPPPSGSGDFDTIYDFGSGVGVGSSLADTAAFQAWATQSDKSLFLPETTGSIKYHLIGDLRVTRDSQWIIGQSWRSRLYLHNTARIIFGEAVALPGPVKDATKDVSFNGIRNLSIEGDPRNGEMVLLDYVDFFRFENVFFNVPNLDATKLTHGIKCNWTEWVTFDRVISYVNGYNVYIYLDNVPGDNEDHYTFFNCNLFTAKRAVAGSQPSNVFVERVAGRADFLAVREFNVFGGHWGKFWSDGGDAAAEGNAVALTIKNELPTTDVRCLTNAQFNGTWFENHARVVDMGTLTLRETSTVTLRGCSALAVGYLGKGSGFSKSNIVVEDMIIENATESPSFVGCKIFASGGRNISSLTSPPTVDDLSSALVWGAPQIRSGGRLWQQGSKTVAAGAISVQISYNLHTTSHNVYCDPGWPTSWYISARSATTFTVTFTNPPATDAIMRWRAETASDRLEDIVATGTADASVKTGDYLLTINDNGRTIIMNAAGKTVTVPASTTLGKAFRCRVEHAFASGVTTIIVTGTGNVTVGPDKYRDIYFGGTTGLLARVGPEVAVTSMV